MRGDRVAAAAVVATLAFWAYTQTLLPGVDLGDSGGFQAAVLWPVSSARQAYPLYYALATPFVRAVSAADPARGLNLFSAICAAVASGLLAWIVSAVVDSLICGVIAGVLLTFSYTFWTQAIIAEVYALHLALVGLCLIALRAFARIPTRARLAIFFAIYALGFGNHLSMVLLLIPFTVFLLQVHPRPRELFRPAVVMMAVTIAIVGALQYLPNLMAVWSSVDAPERWNDRLAAFWFDTTKADWRASMVFGTRRDMTFDRLAMWVWDARQQFGLFGLAVACIGAVRLWTIARAWAVLIAGSYAVSAVFAVTYNVGDTHVFFLPAHFFTAFAAGAAVAPFLGAGVHARQRTVSTGRMRHLGSVFAGVIVLYGGWRAWDTWPAVNRHDDRRGEALVRSLAAGLNDRTDLLVAHLNWQSENALLYAARYERPELAWARLPDVLPHFPFLVHDNQDIGRDVVLTADAAADVIASYGPLFPIVQDDTTPSLSIAASTERIAAGTPYVLCLLTPPSDERFDRDDFDGALRRLTGGHLPRRTAGAYEVIAGVVGNAPTLYRSSNRPFHVTTALLGDEFTIRMESWVPSDTFRRAGFGHVLRGRERVLFVERGVSLVSFGADGSPSQIYAAGLYASRPRFRIPAGVTQLATHEP